MAFGDNWEQMAARGADQYSDEWRKSKKDKRIEELTAQVQALTATVKELTAQVQALTATVKALREELKATRQAMRLVDERFGCAVCGNVDMDTLVWNEDDDTVTCGRCGHTYDPLGGGR